MNREFVKCPGCDHVVEAVNGRYETHKVKELPRLEYCFMSGMPQPVEGLNHAAMVDRAQIVACLATEVQDQDPHAVWRYLGALPAEFVKELLQVALAAIDVEGKRVSEIWTKWDWT